MTWNYNKARTRIENIIKETPDITVQRFSDEYMPLYEARKTISKGTGSTISPPLFNLQKGETVLINTIQIYIAICNYDNYQIENGEETETSHERAMRFLNFYYSACDRVAEQSLIQRVDFHNGRMHAIIADQTGEGLSNKHVAEAFRFVESFKAVAQAANRELAQEKFTAEFRVGIDAGQCIAINNGVGVEQEPMFLGSSANYAAKLADGTEPGIFISNNIRILMKRAPTLLFEGISAFDQSSIDEAILSQSIKETDRFSLNQRSAELKSIIEYWQNEIRDEKALDPTRPRFTFYFKEPPLKTIDYSELMPSHSLRMPVISMFVDICGYTKFIDEAIQKNNISAAVKALYVFREEFQNVLEKDFGGRKVRFIGDCIHGLIAEGSKTEIDGPLSVTSSVKCTGALRESFSLCQDYFIDTRGLGLSVGIELGPTPISRLGIRGDRSVRVASSVTTATSEKCQQTCEVNQTSFGPNALDKLPIALQDLFSIDGIANDLEYNDIMNCLSVGATPLQAPMIITSTDPEPNPGRAHTNSRSHSSGRAHMENV